MATAGEGLLFEKSVNGDSHGNLLEIFCQFDMHLLSTEEQDGMKLTFAERVYWLVCRIPIGRVMTYGDIAVALGAPRGARVVGSALRHCPDPDNVPWQRVVNARGGISPRHPEQQVRVQAKLLKQEGIELHRDGALCFLDLSHYSWWPNPVQLTELEAIAETSPEQIASELPYTHRQPPHRRKFFESTASSCFDGSRRKASRR